MWYWNWLFLAFVCFLFNRAGTEKTFGKIRVADHGDPRYDRLLTNEVNTTESNNDSIDDLKKEIAKSRSQSTHPPRTNTGALMNEVSLLRNSLLQAIQKSKDSVISPNLMNVLEADKKSRTEDMKLTAVSVDTPEQPVKINVVPDVIDSRIANINTVLNNNRSTFNDHFNIQDNSQIHQITDNRASANDLYRESLNIVLIREEPGFRLGHNVLQWKAITTGNVDALIGRTINSIVLVVGRKGSYELVQEETFEVTISDVLCLEVMKIWDDALNDERSIVLVAVKSQLIWYELHDYHLTEIWRWDLYKNIEHLIHFKLENSNILLLSTLDTNHESSANFFEFDIASKQQWIIQVIPLEMPAKSMSCLDIGKDFVVAFVQDSQVKVYKYQYTKFQRGMFVLFKEIGARNASVVSGFRIGGFSYLAIGGEEPKILRYFKDDFYPQTILSQTFGFVEEYMPIPLRTFRDDLILLVQHRLQFPTHTAAVLEALIWNGIAFDPTLSVPCQTFDPNAHGFTCMLDLEREEGLMGATFIQQDKELSIIVPRHEVHSGLFRINYNIIDAQDPFIKEMDQLKKSFDLIMQMLDYEESVKKEADIVLNSTVNPYEDHFFENAEDIGDIRTEFLEFQENNVLENDKIEFLNMAWTKDDFLVSLDEMEKTLGFDEQKLLHMENELNQLIRNNREAVTEPVHLVPQPIEPHYIGPYNFNGQLDPKTIRVLTPEESQRPRRQIQPIKEFKLRNLNVKNIVFETVNGIPASELVFSENGRLNLLPNGNLTISDSVFVKDVVMSNEGRVNGINIDKDVLAIDSQNFPRSLVLEQVIVGDNLQIGSINQFPVDVASLEAGNVPTIDTNLANITAKSVVLHGNLKVETINGILWSELMKKIIPKHLPAQVEQVVVNGDVILGEQGPQLIIDQLNDILFPSEVVLRSGPRETVITGRKTFLGSLSTNAMDVNGKIDGIIPQDIITLNQNQYIQEEQTFQQLEVTQSLEVNGTISGKNLDEFLSNPTLEQTNEIAASCSFRDLIVTGPIFIEESLNGENLELVLSDVVYENSEGEDLIISAVKTFKNLEVKGNVDIKSGFLNDINLDNVMLTNVEQTVDFQGPINGDIIFENLKVSGVYDGINATELEQNAIRTFGDQFTESELVFVDKSHFHATGGFVRIEKTLNDIPVDEFLDQDTDVIEMLAGEVLFNELIVDNLIADGDVVGPGVLNNIDLKELEATHLSKSQPQIINVPVRIKNLRSDEVFESQTINQMDMKKFKSYINKLKNYKDLLMTGEMEIDNLIVEGDVYIPGLINGRSFQRIIDNAIWLNRPNDISTKLLFLDEVVVESMIVDGTINKKAFERFVKDVVSVNDDNIHIAGEVIFVKDLFVNGNLNTSFVNNIPFDDILMKPVEEGQYLVMKSLNLNGSLIVNKLQVDQQLNTRRVDELVNSYYYDVATDTHVISQQNRQIVHFNAKEMTINSLTTELINKMNVSCWMSNLIRTDESNIVITSNKRFQQNVVFQNGVNVKYFRDIDLKVLKDIVLINEPEIIHIHGSVSFDGPTYVPLIALSRDVQSQFISGIDTLEWRRNAIRIDKNFTSDGELRIEASKLIATKLWTKYLNGKPMRDLLTLHTDQLFLRNVTVDYVVVKNQVYVHGLVNNLNLVYEKMNTVMRFDTHQVIQAKTTFQGARVLNLLIANERINGKYLKNVALLNSDITIESPISMQSVTAQSLYTDYPISTINFNNHYNNVLWTNSMDQQVVHGKWSVKNGNVKGNVYGNGLINGLNVNEIQNNFHKHLELINNVTSNYADFYQKTCNEIQYNVNVSSQENVHILKYFELVTFEEVAAQCSEEIFSSFTFETPAGVHYLAINRNCTTRLFMWEWEKEEYRLMERISLTGIVYNWLAISLNDDVFIVTNSKMELTCNYSGTNIWKVYNGELVFLRKIRDHDEVLEMHTNVKKTPPSFYLLLNNDMVLEYDVFGYQLNQWQLLVGRGNYNFLSDDLELGVHVALCDGKTLITLESQQSRGTKMRRHLVDGPEMSGLEDSPITYIKQIGKSKSRKQRKFFSNEIISLPRIPSVQLRSTDNTSLSEKLKTIGLKVKTDLDERFKNFGKLAIKNVTLENDVKMKQLPNLPVAGNKSTDAPESRVINLKVIESKNKTETKNNQLRNIPTVSPTRAPEPEMNKTKIKEKSPMDKITDLFTKAEKPELGIVKEEEVTTKSGIVKEIGSAKVSTKEPESTTVSSEETGSTKMSVKETGSTKVTTKEHGSSTVSSKEAGNTTVTLKQAGSTKVSSKEPGSATVSLKEAGNTTKTSKKSGSITEKPKELGSSAVSKEAGNATKTPDKAGSTTENPKESGITNVTSKDPETTTVSSKKPVSTTKAPKKAENTTEKTKEAGITTKTPMKSSSSKETSIPSTTSKKPSNDTQGPPSLTPNTTLSPTPLARAKESSTQSTTTQTPSTTSADVEKPTPVIPINSFTPRIIMKSFDDIGVDDNVKETFDTKFPEDFTQATDVESDLIGNGDMEGRVAYEVPTGGVRTAENGFLPEKGAGELLVLYVGPNNQKRKLYAVSQTRESTIKGNYNVIRIYEDVIQGIDYQSIHCSQPSNLVTLQFRDETLLAFLEGNSEVHVFIYRGIQGFIEFTKFKLPAAARQMTVISLPPKVHYKCNKHYLMLRMEREILFMEMKITGNCGLTKNLKCDES